MAKRVEDSSRERYLSHLFEVLAQNEAFLHENAQDLYTEIVALGNDAIDYIGGWSRSETGPGEYVEAAMRHFEVHVFLPASGAIHLNALAGNLPGCYGALRLALESLVKCYLADMWYPDQGFFRDRIRSLEKSRHKGSKTTTDLMREWDDHLGRKDGATALWRDLSRMWLHADGIIEGIMGWIVEHEATPAWGIVLPQAYATGDVLSLNEFKGRLSHFRSLLRYAISSTGS